MNTCGRSETAKEGLCNFIWYMSKTEGERNPKPILFQLIKSPIWYRPIFKISNNWVFAGYYILPSPKYKTKVLSNSYPFLFFFVSNSELCKASNVSLQLAKLFPGKCSSKGSYEYMKELFASMQTQSTNIQLTCDQFLSNILYPNIKEIHRNLIYIIYILTELF